MSESKQDPISKRDPEVKVESGAPSPEQLKAMQATIPMNRIGEPDECAGTLIYLASDELSGYVTGQVIEVNGGQYMP